jgi:thiol-disulfide isomerase/thioredoxin
MVAAVVAVSSALTLAACGGSSNAANKAGLGVITTWNAADRKALPEMSGATLGGGSLDVASLKGKVIVVNFWGSWCGPCQDEAGYLQDTYQKYADKGVAFVGVDTRDGTDSAQANTFVRTNKITYPNLIDGDDEKYMKDFVGVVPLDSVPATLIVDRQGKIAWRALIGINSTQLQTGLDSILAEK